MREMLSRESPLAPRTASPRFFSHCPAGLRGRGALARCITVVAASVGLLAQGADLAAANPLPKARRLPIAKLETTRAVPLGELASNSTYERWLGLEPPPEGEAGDDSGGGAAPEDDLARAQELFAEGSALYETADYAGAIDAWTQAYALVPAVPGNADIRTKLIYDIAAAQEKAFEIDRRRDHLEQARVLFATYLENIDSLGLAMVDLERERGAAQSRLDQLVARLEQFDKEEERRLREERAASRRRASPGVPMIALGSVAVTVGVGGTALLTAGAVIGAQANDISGVPVSDLEARQAQFERGRMGNTMLIAGAAVGTLGIGAGVALLVIGVRRRDAARAQKNARAEGRRQEVMVAPAFGGRDVGLVLSGRF